MKKIITLSVLVLSFIIATPSFAVTKTIVETEASARPLPATPTACVINTFVATPNVIVPGGTSTLQWSTTGCNHVMIDGVAQAATGNLAVGPLTTTKLYLLTAYPNTSGCDTQTCPFKRTAVVVNADICPNMEGVQTTIPSGMNVNTQGHCVSATPSITILSPNGGEQFSTNDSLPFSYKLTYRGYGDTMYHLVQYPSLSNPGTAYPIGGGVDGANNQPDYIMSGNIGIIGISYPNIIPGQYYLKVTFVSNDGTQNLVDFSDASFTIQAPNPATCVAGTPSVKILSPNGGEIYRVGDTLSIRWKHCVGQTSTFTVDNNTPVAIKLDDENIVATYGMQLIGTTTIGAGSYTWIIPNELGSYSSLNGNNYLIGIETTVHSVSDISDFSNSAFSITNTGGRPTAPAGCTATTVYSPTTGKACGTIALPPGLTTKTTLPGNTAVAFTRELKLGASGADVTALQNRLKAEGVYASKVTGYFGTMTQAAVKRYQAKYGIPAVGNVGPRTLQTLNK